MRKSTRVASAILAITLTLGQSARAQVVDVDDAAGHPGDTVEVDVRLAAEGSGASALRIDLGFDPSAPIAARAGRPACGVNPDIMKESTTFKFLPASCAHGIDCTQLQVAVISFTKNNPVPIADGVVFTCELAIPPGAEEGTQLALSISAASAVFPDGSEVDVTGASRGGVVEVLGTVPCPGDLDEDGEVTLGEVQKAFDAYLDGCPEPPAGR